MQSFGGFPTHQAVASTVISVDIDPLLEVMILTYVSFKKRDDGSYVPLVLHDNWFHVFDTYGGDRSGRDGRFLSENLVIDGPMKQHFRCKDVFVRAILNDGEPIFRD
jgi:hypothetical protein